MTLTGKQKLLIHSSLLMRIRHVENLINSWRSEHLKSENDDRLIQLYEEELSQLKELLEIIP